MCCKSFQTKKGCCARNSECPEGKLHRCSFALGNGRLCGSQQHGTCYCDAHKAGGGGAGGGGGKSEWVKKKNLKEDKTGDKGKGRGRGKGYGKY